MEGVIAVIAVIGPGQLSLMSRSMVKFQTQTHKRKLKQTNATFNKRTTFIAEVYIIYAKQVRW